MEIILQGSEKAITKFLKYQRTHMKRKGISVVEKHKPINKAPEFDTDSEIYKITKLYAKTFNKPVPKNKTKDINWIKQKIEDAAG
jgi:hypothetical protein